MLKRFAILVLGATVLLTGVYYLRVQVATKLFNSALKDSDLNVLKLSGLEVGWRTATIGDLVLGVGNENTPQHLQDIELTYALLDLRPGELTIHRASLQVPGASTEEATAPLLLTELVQQLSSAPLDALTVHRLELAGASLPLVEQPLTLDAALKPGSVILSVTDNSQTRLKLNLGETGQSATAIALHLASNGQLLLQLAVDVSAAGDELQLAGSGKTDLENLAAFVAPVAPLPDTMTAVRGVLPFELTARFDDDLNATSEIRAAVLLPARSALDFELAAETDDPALIDIHLELGQALSLDGLLTESREARLSLATENIVLRAEEQRGSLAGSLSALRCNYQGELTCQGEADVSGQAPDLELAGDEITRLTGTEVHFDVDFKLQGEHLELVARPGQWAAVDQIQQGENVLRQVTLAAGKQAILAFDTGRSEFSLLADDLSLSFPSVALPGLHIATQLTLSALTVRHPAGSPITVGTHLAAESINLQSEGSWLPALALQSDVSLIGDQLNAAGTLRSDQGKSLLTFSALHDMGKAAGAGRISTGKVSFNAGDNTLSSYFAYWPFEFDIYEGEFSSRGDFDWRQSAGEIELEGDLDTRMTDLAGFYGELGFIGLSGDIPARLASPQRIFTPTDARLTLDQVDVGVPIEAISARFRLDSARQELDLKTMEARMFDGRIWTEGAVYRADRASNRIDIGVDGLQLDQLLALAGYDAVEGSGSISGLLPLDIGTAGITMQRGMLAAKAPGGVFRYRAEIAPGTNPAMAQAMEALSNYHYSIFQAEADYLDTGDLELSMMLRGLNPDMDQARPIHLNLNVTDNIPMLLKSLQSGRVIADMVSKKVGGAP